ncbi:LytR/AlgR family response regulator transcription factor [Fulvivirga sediminis]|uniref:Response regulator transcription factor n=1 Tax=Fulvivirga sediminis TaxID=2803949 RepID=A0A937JYR0_9BACT|nr:LytTR family DNA-binding domain-containing protein [Fulvivirga sediminis]MBL3654520.1 response regulator transcription factor [Fulvivirga sediminis]
MQVTYKCVIVDDEELARQLIENHIALLDNFEVIASCADAIEANNVLKSEKVDLMFLDIEMPVMKGTDFLKNLIKRPCVIFTTAYRDFALDGFELNVIDYLLKPITFSRFFKGIEKFLNAQQPSVSPKETLPTKDSIFIRVDRKQFKVTFDEVLYIESIKDYVKIVTEKDQHLTKKSLKSFEKLLDNRFQQIHRSFIVNLNKLTAFTKQDVEIGDIELPIGENYKLELIRKLTTQEDD